VIIRQRYKTYESITMEEVRSKIVDVFTWYGFEVNGWEIRDMYGNKVSNFYISTRKGAVIVDFMLVRRGISDYAFRLALDSLREIMVRLYKVTFEKEELVR